MMPLVTISITVWNGLEDTKKCLKTLSAITYKPTEIIIVDNGSADGTVEYIRKNYPKVKVYENGLNLGFTGGHNRAIQYAKGKYFLLLNNDIEVEPGFLEPLVKDLEGNKKLAAVQSKTYLSKNQLDNTGSFLTPLGFLKHYGFKQTDSPEYDIAKKVFSPKAACLLITKQAIDRFGLFDNDYFAYFEETDWAWRIYLTGLEIMFEPQSKVLHKLGKTSTRLPYSFIYFHSSKNTIRSIIKNTGFKSLLYMLPLHLLALNFIGLTFLLQGKTGMFFSVIKAQIWNISHLFRTLKLRANVQNIRKVSDKELFNFIMEPLNLKNSFKQYLQIRKNS